MIIHNLILGSYAITIQGEEFNVIERILDDWKPGYIVDSTFDALSIADFGMRKVRIIREWNVYGTYDFTDLFQCNIRRIPIISAIGASIAFAYHNQRDITMIGCNCKAQIDTTDTIATTSVLSEDTTSSTPSPHTPSPFTWSISKSPRSYPINISITIGFIVMLVLIV